MTPICRRNAFLNLMHLLRQVVCGLGITLASFPVMAIGVDGALLKIKESRTVVIAHRDSSVPFSYLDENRKPVGYAIDLCLQVVEAIRRHLKMPQLQVDYVSVNPATRMATIAEGRADLECGSTTNTASRRMQVSFTIPHFIASARMLTRSASGIRDWPDLRNKKVVTTKGTTTVKLVQERDKARALGITLIEAKDHAEAFEMVRKGSADAFAMDDVLLYGLRAGTDNPADFVVTGEALSVEPYAIVLRKDDEPFKRLVDREMGRIIADGDIHKIYDKWFRHPIPPKGINLNMPMGHLMKASLRFPTDKVGD